MEWWPCRWAHSHYSPTRPANYMCYAWGEGGSAAQAPFLRKKLFFIFDHFSPKKWKKNTRTSMLAAVTSLPRVRLHLTFVWKMSNFFFSNCVCTRALHMCFHSYMCKDLAHSSQFTHSPQTMLAPRRHTVFLSFASHSLLPPSSFLSCVDVWLHGSH